MLNTYMLPPTFDYLYAQEAFVLLLCAPQNQAVLKALEIIFRHWELLPEVQADAFRRRLLRRGLVQHLLLHWSTQTRRFFLYFLCFRLLRPRGWSATRGKATPAPIRGGRAADAGTSPETATPPGTRAPAPSGRGDGQHASGGGRTASRPKRRSSFDLTAAPAGLAAVAVRDPTAVIRRAKERSVAQGQRAFGGGGHSSSGRGSGSGSGSGGDRGEEAGDRAATAGTGADEEGSDAGTGSGDHAGSTEQESGAEVRVADLRLVCSLMEEGERPEVQPLDGAREGTFSSAAAGQWLVSVGVSADARRAGLLLRQLRADGLVLAVEPPSGPNSGAEGVAGEGDAAPSAADSGSDRTTLRLSGLHRSEAFTAPPRQAGDGERPNTASGALQATPALAAALAPGAGALTRPVPPLLFDTVSGRRAGAALGVQLALRVIVHDVVALASAHSGDGGTRDSAPADTDAHRRPANAPAASSSQAHAAEREAEAVASELAHADGQARKKLSDFADSQRAYAVTLRAVDDMANASRKAAADAGERGEVGADSEAIPWSAAQEEAMELVRDARKAGGGPKAESAGAAYAVDALHELEHVAGSAINALRDAGSTGSASLPQLTWSAVILDENEDRVEWKTASDVW